MKAVLFDIDGVLIDSRIAYFEFHKKQISDIGGKVITKKELDPLFGMTMANIIKFFYPELSQDQVNRICHVGVKIYPKFYRFIKKVFNYSLSLHLFNIMK